MKFQFLKAAGNRLKSLAKISLIVLLTTLIFFPAYHVDAGALTTVKDTLSNSRPSVSTAISSTITAGDTTINVANSSGIQINDSIVLCTAACATTETRIVSGVISQTQIALTVGATNTYAAGSVYLKSTSRHTLTFTTRSTVSGGKFVVSIPASNTTTPVSTGFGVNQITTADISLSGATAGSISTTTQASNVLFTVPFTGSVASNTAITLTIGNTNNLLNPTKTAAAGTADANSITVTEQDSGSNPVDSTSIQVATIEAVGVSATVSPSLNFTINAVASGTNIVGYGTNVSSTATTVPFGTLTIGATSTIAQYLHVDTNSNSGYAVTVQQDGSLRKTNGTTIVDFNSAVTQNNEAATGFGYSLANKTGTDAAFLYNASGTFNGRGFSSSTPFSIMSNGGPVTGSEVYVLYRVNVNSTQAQGDYKNVITYIATASY